MLLRWIKIFEKISKTYIYQKKKLCFSKFQSLINQLKYKTTRHFPQSLTTKTRVLKYIEQK